MTRMTVEELLAPVKPWRDDVIPVSQEQAVTVIANGFHAQAAIFGRNYERDAVLIDLIQKNQITCAFEGNGGLLMKPTRLSYIQRMN